MRDYKIIPKASEKIDLDILREHLDNLDLSNPDNLNFWIYCKIAMRSGLRSVDILNMKARNIYFTDRKIYLVEQKTKKEVVVPIDKVVADKIEANNTFITDEGVYTSNPDYYVLWNKKYSTQVSLMTINRRLKKVYEGSGTNVSSHSIRKAVATKIYEGTGNNIIKAMIFLNHSSPVTTKNYLGITKAEKQELYKLLD